MNIELNSGDSFLISFNGMKHKVVITFNDTDGILIELPGSSGGKTIYQEHKDTNNITRDPWENPMIGDVIYCGDSEYEITNIDATDVYYQWLNGEFARSGEKIISRKEHARNAINERIVKLSSKNLFYYPANGSSK